MNILDHFPRKSTNGSSDEISVAVRHGDCGRAWVAECGAQSNQEIETNQAFIFFSDRSPQPQPYLSRGWCWLLACCCVSVVGGKEGDGKRTPSKHCTPPPASCITVQEAYCTRSCTQHHHHHKYDQRLAVNNHHPPHEFLE